jgi:hypothetical protein
MRWCNRGTIRSGLHQAPHYTDDLHGGQAAAVTLSSLSRENAPEEITAVRRNGCQLWQCGQVLRHAGVTMPVWEAHGGYQAPPNLLA